MKQVFSAFTPLSDRSPSVIADIRLFQARRLVSRNGLQLHQSAQSHLHLRL